MKNQFPYLSSFFVLSFLLLSSMVFGQVKRVESIDITVRNLEKSIHFYQSVLGFKKVSIHTNTLHRTKTAKMKLGDETINLVQYPGSKGRPIPKDMKSNDLYFQHIAIVVRDIDSAYAILRKYMASPISPMPQTIPKSNEAAAGVRAYYFHDIDNHDLELIYFPEDKGQEKWHQKTSRLFLGIDHTAIGISNTDSSLNFYQNILGIEKKGESLNQGIEQSALSHVKGAKVHITGLRTNNGPGIEFLQYLVPGPGKPYPRNTKMSDIWYWQIVLVTDHLDSLYNILQDHHYHLRTPIRISKGKRFSKYFIVQDPDGHALYLKE